MYSRKSNVLEPNFRNRDFESWDVLRSSESKNPILSGWFVCVCLHASIISIHWKQVIVGIPSLELGFCIICRCYLEVFHEEQTNIMCTGNQPQKNLEMLLPIDGISF